MLVVTITAVAVAAAVLLALTARGLLRATRGSILVTVRGNSMAPTFRNGDRVVARRQPGDTCRAGDVVVFAVHRTVALRGDPPLRLKRVAAVAGDPAPPWMAGEADQRLGVVVPPGHVAVCGDNDVTETSKDLGYVPYEAVIGVVATNRHRPDHELNGRLLGPA
jgi:signal peptidase I